MLFIIIKLIKACQASLIMDIWIYMNFKSLHRLLLYNWIQQQGCQFFSLCISALLQIEWSFYSQNILKHLPRNRQTDQNIERKQYWINTRGLKTLDQLITRVRFSREKCEHAQTLQKFNRSPGKLQDLRFNSTLVDRHHYICTCLSSLLHQS